ncbi:MAG: hypothetical protein EGP67_02160 [Bacteroidales bacterium]|nr:hypothetical protein [Bacteroidales bacterium]
MERKELAQFSFPMRSLFYGKIVQGEWKEKSLLNFLFRGAAYFILPSLSGTALRCVSCHLATPDNVRGNLGFEQG